MTEDFKQPDPSNESSSESGVLELLKKIQQHLVYLERKIDALGQGGAATPKHSHKAGYFSRPYNRAPFDRPQHRKERTHGRHPEEMHSQKPHYDNPPRDTHSGFRHGKKKFFRHHRKDRP
jgi:hypothetical protein